MTSPTTLFKNWVSWISVETRGVSVEETHVDVALAVATPKATDATTAVPASVMVIAFETLLDVATSFCCPNDRV